MVAAAEADQAVTERAYAELAAILSGAVVVAVRDLRMHRRVLGLAEFPSMAAMAEPARLTATLQRLEPSQAAAAADLR